MGEVLFFFKKRKLFLVASSKAFSLVKAYTHVYMKGKQYDLHKFCHYVWSSYIRTTNPVKSFFPILFAHFYTNKITDIGRVCRQLHQFLRSVSPICTAFRAAPLRIWSPHTNMQIPVEPWPLASPIALRSYLGKKKWWSQMAWFRNRWFEGKVLQALRVYLMSCAKKKRE